MAKEKANKFFSEQEQHKIVSAIREWEKETTGEIKIHIENECKVEPLLRAKELFQKLKLYETENRNAVLIYLAVQSHTFAVWGDTGINQKVDTDFWNTVAWIIEDHFKDGLYLVGTSEAVKLVGRKLIEFFPIGNDSNENEISNDISFA